MKTSYYIRIFGLSIITITMIVIVSSYIARRNISDAPYLVLAGDVSSDYTAPVFLKTDGLNNSNEAVEEYPYTEAGYEDVYEPEEEIYEDYPDYNIYEGPEVITITISAAGDTTLGGDSRWHGYHAFMREYNNNGLRHFFYNVRHIFGESDLSIVNLEGVLTDITEPHMDKQFVFRGPPHFARILTYGNINAVTIANNHTIDFFDRGYRDTAAALEREDIAYFGNEFNTIMEINGIYVGLFGFRVWNDGSYNRSRITNAINDLKDRGAQLIIAYHHWGVERVTYPEQYQINMGRFTIQQGAHLVLGAHPHVLNGVEIYQGRNIVYSLANFSFGGNANPPDQDSMIFQQTFTFVDGELQEDNETNIIPVFVSSVRYRNNFKPTIAQGYDAERILGRIRRYSEALAWR